MNNSIAIHRFQTLPELQLKAAELLLDEAARRLETQMRFCVVLSGGSTPRGMYQHLKQAARRIDWTRVHLYWGDERCVPPEDAESNYGDAWRLWLADFCIPPENIHRIKGELPPRDGVADYASELRLNAAAGNDVPDFDLIYLGLGSDGHTASLFPGSELDDEHTHVKLVSANYQDRPALRITLTPAAFAFARRIVFLVSGTEKAQAVAATLTGPMDAVHYPAQRITLHQGRIDWFLDAASAALLPENLQLKHDSEDL